MSFVVVLIGKGNLTNSVFLVQVSQVLFNLLVDCISLGVFAARTVVEPDFESDIVVLFGLELVDYSNPVYLFYYFVHIARGCLVRKWCQVLTPCRYRPVCRCSPPSNQVAALHSWSCVRPPTPA